MKQGSACVGLVSKEFAVVATIKRAVSDLGTHQQKICKIDEHVGMALSGLIADGRFLAKFMRNECLNHRWVYEAPLQVGRLVGMVSDKSQVYTQKSEKRPYGVGLLVVGFDKTGPHLYETNPSGNYYEYVAQAIGARSQSSRTYLERHYSTFAKASLKELIRHAIRALKGATTDKLTSAMLEVAFVGKNIPFQLVDVSELPAYIAEAADEDEKDDSAAAAAAANGEGSNPGADAAAAQAAADAAIASGANEAKDDDAMPVDTL